MKKIFFYLVTLSTASTFSFRKMEPLGTYKIVTPPKVVLAFAYDFNQADQFFEALHKSNEYYAFVYDPVSRFLFSTQGINWKVQNEPSPEDKILDRKYGYKCLIGNTFSDVEEAKKSFGFLLDPQVSIMEPSNLSRSIRVIMRCFSPNLHLLNTDQAAEIPKHIKSWISYEDGLLPNPIKYDKYGLSPDSNRRNSSYNNWNNVYLPESKIRIIHTPEKVTLTQVLDNKEGKPINFQDALKKYLEKQKPSIDEVAQPFIKFLNRRQNPSTHNPNKNENTKITVDSLMSEFQNKSEKNSQIEQYQKLLNDSEILMVQYIIPNDQLTQVDSTKDPSQSTILGTAIDKETNTTFYWVTEVNLTELFKE